MQRFSSGRSDTRNCSIVEFEALEGRTLLSALPVVSIIASQPDASENGDMGQFVVSRDVATNAPLKVSLTISGTAKNGTDYNKIATSVTIPANASSATVTIAPIDDGKTEQPETIAVAIKPGKTYTVDAAAPSDTATIADATYLAADFFPMVDGASWYYTGLAKGTAFNESMVAQAQGGDFLYNYQTDTQLPLGGYGAFLFGTTASGIVTVADQLPDQSMMYYDQAPVFLPASMQIGSSYSSNGTQNQGEITWSQTVKVVGLETVATPAGQFRALKVQTTKDAADSNSGSHDVRTLWFARGVGIVKLSDSINIREEQGNHVRQTASWELTSWSISSPWSSKASMNTARDQFAGGVIDGKIYVFGGNGNPDGINLKSTEVYDPAQNTWTFLANNENNNGDGVEEVSGVGLNGKFYVFGAYGGQTSLGYGNFNFVQEYDPATDTWTPKAPKPTPVSNAPSVVYNGEIYVFGGEFGYEDAKGKFHSALYNTVEAYNPTTDKWRVVGHMPKALHQAQVVVAGDTAYVVAGWTGSIANPKLQKGLLAYNFVTGTWTTTGLANAPPPRLTCGAISMPDGKIYLIAGGSAKGNILWETNRVDIYDTATNTWSSGPSLPAPVGAHVALVAGDTLYVLGGSRVEDTSLADVWALTLT